MSLRDQLREKIIDAVDVPTAIVDVPEWGVKVEIRGLTLKQVGEVVARTAGNPSNVQQADLVIASAYDPESGERLFEPSDRDMLLGKAGGAMLRLWRKAFEFSGLSDQRVEEAEADLGPTLSDG